MKKFALWALTALLTVGSLAAQNNNAQPHQCPHHGTGQHCGKHQQSAVQAQPQVNADGLDLSLVAAFPTVKSVKKADKWAEVYNAEGKLLGYAIYSQPKSDGIKGYAGETPVLIALDLKKNITGVYLLPNSESPGYVQRVKDAGLFNQWNGLSIKKAKKKQVDTVTGATYTSRAVIQSVQAALAAF